MRLLILANSRSALSLELVASAVRLARARSEIELVAICDACRVAPPGLRESARELVERLTMRMFGESASLGPVLRQAAGLRAVHGASVVVPPARDVNHPVFIAQVHHEFKPDAALSLGCEQILGGDLLAALGRTVNYHTSLLPAYRGLRSTAWSFYHGEPVTGFSYHLMEEELDAGPILLQRSTPIGPRSRPVELEREKIRLAIETMPEVLEALLRGDEGEPQVGIPSYFGRNELREITSINDPSVVAWEEFQLRLRAFAMLTISIRGRRYPVTRLRRVNSGRPHHPTLAFTTIDGIVVEASRLRYLPVPVHRAYRRMRRRIAETQAL